MKLKHDGIWGWDIYDLNRCGIYDLNGWGIYGGAFRLKWVGHVQLRWVGQLWQTVFWKISSKSTGLQGSTLSGHRMTMGFGPFELPRNPLATHNVEAWLD